MPDTDKNPEPRVYGQADESNRNPPAPGGMRGEQGNTLADPNPEQTQDERVQGATITVTEVSGTAFAEKTGRSGLAREGSIDGKVD
ncbi:hypothetical protein [uncultured Sphingomonas sp.]|uniref:hypothetical protein n=1 Tax=uncultured Sphingomonas sp. TaxID=158754 RepID=UPI0035CA5EF5